MACPNCSTAPSLPPPLARASWRTEPARMAKGGSSSHVPGGAAPPPIDALGSDRDRIIDATLRLIPQQGWRRLSMAAIAAEADLPILNLFRAFGSKPAILCAFFRRIDEAALTTPLEPETDERPRDR